MTIEEVVRQAEPKLRKKANVVGVGQGERGGKPVIKVLVTRKLPEAELRKEDRVPKTVRGVPTDVVEIGVVSAQSEPE
jgi:hypothetical protein